MRSRDFCKDDYPPENEVLWV